MIRFNYKPSGTPPATLNPPPGAASEVRMGLTQYSGGEFHEREFDSVDDLLGAFRPGMVNWINIDGLGDTGLLKKVAGRFDIHPLAIEDVLNTAQRPKIERFGEHFFIVSEMVYFDRGGELCFEQVSMFLGRDFLLTVQEEPGHDVFEMVRGRLRTGTGYARRMGADYLAYALLDAVVDHLFPVLEQVGDSIEDVEEELLESPRRESLKRLYGAKRLLVALRRAAWPHREIFNAMMRDDTGLVQPATQVFLRDCYDHVTQIIDVIESYRDLGAGLMDLYLTSLGFRTNEIIRVLTIVSVFFIPLTFLAGVYGMNFDTAHPLNMPELRSPFGYIGFWTVCVLIALGMFAFFKHRKWL
jgi:magnesium transporter